MVVKTKKRFGKRFPFAVKATFLQHQDLNEVGVDKHEKMN